MKKLLETLRSRKGITMTEVIVAMAMVLIVSGAAISLLVASVQFDAKYDSQTKAMNAAESAVACVRFADTIDDMNVYLGMLNYTFDGAVQVEVNGLEVRVTFENEVLYEKIFTS